MGYREPVPGLKDSDGLPVLALPPGTVMRRGYQVHFLALGGMSLCYRGDCDGRVYFLKEVSTQDAREVMALNQEKALLERFDHPAIVKVHQLFEEDGFYYLVLDFVEGKSLDCLISPFPDNFLQDQVVADWGRQLCDVLGYLHRQEPVVIYRDLKPRNVVKDGQGRLHLVDFGIARLFKAGKARDTEALGSALTASPEHYSGQTDVRSDVYSLGATLHYLLTNGRCPRESPFEFNSPRSVNTRMSAALEQVVMKALEVDPTRRWQTMAELDQALASSFGPPPTATRAGAAPATRAAPVVARQAEETVPLRYEPAVARPAATPPWMWALLGGLATAVVLGMVWLGNAPRVANGSPSLSTVPSTAPSGPVVPPPAVRPTPAPASPTVPPPARPPVAVRPNPTPTLASPPVRPTPAPTSPPVAVRPTSRPPDPQMVPAPTSLRDWLGDLRGSDPASWPEVQGDLVAGGVRLKGNGFKVTVPESFRSASLPGSDVMLFHGGAVRQPGALRVVSCRRMDMVDLVALGESHLDLFRAYSGSDLSLSRRGREVRLSFKMQMEFRGRPLEMEGRERLVQGQDASYSIAVLSSGVGYARNERELDKILRSFKVD
ncbi:serine/threonine protein kinase [bacterium CPR1]|nr:serine/threonine protein kinase [bacterium CPR1]